MSWKVPQTFKGLRWLIETLFIGLKKKKKTSPCCGHHSVVNGMVFVFLIKGDLLRHLFLGNLKTPVTKKLSKSEVKKKILYN